MKLLEKGKKWLIQLTKDYAKLEVPEYPPARTTVLTERFSKNCCDQQNTSTCRRTLLTKGLKV
jgi:hypothetical protein